MVDAIEEFTDWDLSIVVPNTQRSWIGKAHFAGKDLTASFIYPTNEGNTYQGPFPTPNKELAKTTKEWALLDGTPASCADIGVHHLYKEKGPVDLVISGPNFGRNSTALYITSSGTVGAAMEAALTGVKSIAISYAFESRTTDPVVTAEAAKISVELIKHLYSNWQNDDSDLYAVNIPLIKSLKLGETKIQYAPILPNQWGSIYSYEQPAPSNASEADIVDTTASNKVQFKWTPNFHTVHESVLASEKKGEFNDGIVILNGGIRYVCALCSSFYFLSLFNPYTNSFFSSVTPLKAIFKDVPLTGEIVLK